MKSTIGALNRGFMARVLLAAMGGLGQLVAGFNGHYYADKQTPKRTSKRPRNGRGNYGKNLMNHFTRRGVCFSSKKNKLRKAYGHHYC